MILVFISYLFATSNAYKNGKVYYNEKNIVLPDLGFNFIKDMRNNMCLYKIKEILCLSYLIIFLISIYGNNKAIFEYFISIGIILLFKNILFTATILPDPSQKCSNFSIFKPYKGSCYDLIISTHAVLLFVSLFVIFSNKLYSTIYSILSVITNIIIIYLILALRQHYTIDILNALAYSFLVYYFVSNKIIPSIF